MHGRILVINRVDENRETAPQDKFSEDTIFESWMMGEGADYVTEIPKYNWKSEGEYNFFNPNGYEEKYKGKFHRWKSGDKVGFKVGRAFAREIYEEKGERLLEVLDNIVTAEDFMEKTYQLKNIIERDHETYILEDWGMDTFDGWLKGLKEEEATYEIIQVFDCHF